MANELTIVELKNPLEVFTTPNGLDAVINKIEAEAKSIDRDISTEKGRDNIRSIAFKLAKSKTALDKIGKDLTEEQRAQINTVNAERKRAWDRMEALQAEIRKPLTDWEDAEKNRVAAHENALALITMLPDTPAEDSLELKSRIDAIADYMDRDWQEFSDRAKFESGRVLAVLQSQYNVRIKAEKDAAELARLQAEEAARKKAEHEKRIADEAAEKAKREAEEKAERDRVEAEHIAAAAIKAEQDRLAAVEKKAADDAAAAAKALRDAEEKAERDKQAALKKQADDAAAAKLAEEEETREREANHAHRKKINNEALYSMKEVMRALERTNPDYTAYCQAIVSAIAKGEIPHLKIIY